MTLQNEQALDIILFGGTGDLAQRKLLPALYRLQFDGSLPPDGRIIAAARRPGKDEDFVKLARRALDDVSNGDLDESAWENFSARLTYVTLDEGGYQRLKSSTSGHQRLIYLALPASAFSPVIKSLQQHGLNQDARVVIEKPFGRDTASALELNALLHEAFKESQIFRIDHYLGKETVQNILVLRFGNSIFERLWNRDAIDHVEITVAESEGIGERGSFYEETGALRDIMQNHVLQMLALLMMEPPVVFSPEAIRDEKLKLLRAVQPPQPDCLVRGQYTTGEVAGEKARGYRQEEGVAEDSQTETYAAMKLSIDNWRWAGVPVFLRTGKRLPMRKTEVEVAFKDVPMTFFQNTSMEPPRANHLTLNIQPEESICVSFVSKAPGAELQARQAQMTYCYADPNASGWADAYERLLGEALAGDSTMFVRDDSIERAWAILEPALEAMPPVCSYAGGSWGPPEADALIAPHAWHSNEDGPEAGT